MKKEMERIRRELREQESRWKKKERQEERITELEKNVGDEKREEEGRM